MTTTLDLGSNAAPNMLVCPEQDSNLYPTLVLAMRDMRKAHGRDQVTGEGRGNESWMGLVLGMIILDTLSGSYGGMERRWRRFLMVHGILQEDAEIIYAVRNALLHGYGLPTKPNKTHHRRVVFISSPDAYAIDTETEGYAVISVPVFCGRLVERIAAAAPDSWDVSQIDTNAPDPRS